MLMSVMTYYSNKKAGKTSPVPIPGTPFRNTPFTSALYGHGKVHGIWRENHLWFTQKDDFLELIIECSMKGLSMANVSTLVLERAKLLHYSVQGQT